jgi:hypothetical protein
VEVEVEVKVEVKVEVEVEVEVDYHRKSCAGNGLKISASERLIRLFRIVKQTNKQPNVL